MRLYQRTATIGTQDGKPCIAYVRPSDAVKGEPVCVTYWRKYVSEEKRNLALLDPNQVQILR